MLGRVRTSSMISLEQLEMERTSSKIIKHDSLSIYEATLLKLKQGSHSKTDDSVKTDAHFTMASEDDRTTYADCTSTDTLPNSSPIFQSMDSANNQKSKNMSIHYFFKKCNGSHAQNSNDKEDEMLIDYSSSSSSISPTSSR